MPPLKIGRMPQTDDELHAFVWAVWGIHIPRVSVCPGHSNPFAAFCEAYFARTPVSVWKASRGLGGKSQLLATLCATEAVTLGAHITILGGSAAQSQRVLEVQREAWESPLAPAHLLNSSTMYMTRLNNGAWIRSLTASQRSARGPHPQRLRLDEIDEMDLSILEAAQGQPMDREMLGKMVETQTVMSSTHQYPDKTMTEMLKRAKLQGWSTHEWCYRESMGTKEHPGWLTQSLVDRKKAEIPKHMWDTEYDLQEPSITGRAIQTEFVEFMFDDTLGVYPGTEDVSLEFSQPEQGAQYVTGVDWAKESDWTIVSTWRTDCTPWRRVAWLRTGRKPWPAMIRDVEKRLAKYKGLLVHDATGIGNVVDDFLTYDRMLVTPMIMAGRPRESMFNDYIAAIENREVLGPKIEYCYAEHKYVTWDDLYGSGHAPDSFVADALCWTIRNRRIPVVTPGLVTRPTGSPWRDA
jgi:hypothetical protein